VSKTLPLSAVLITRDAEATLAATLETLSEFPEVIVYDNGSTDRTVEVARGFPNVNVHEGEFMGFGPTKNHAASLAANDWVFSIDSDERLTPELMDSITGADLSNENVVYGVHRLNFLRGKEIRYSGWRNDWLLRVYNRNAAGLSDVAVHENVLPPAGGKVVRLNGYLLHDAVREIGDFLVKARRYAELRRRESLPVYSPAAIFFRSLWAFIRTYFLRLGVLDGWRGLVISVGEANGVFFKYMMTYADSVAEKEQAASNERKS
jgi:glycosyltransferase involved in cell wall biosynthesis